MFGLSFRDKRRKDWNKNWTKVREAVCHDARLKWRTGHNERIEDVGDHRWNTDLEAECAKTMIAGQT